jgi:hypothetical protein
MIAMCKSQKCPNKFKSSINLKLSNYIFKQECDMYFLHFEIYIQIHINHVIFQYYCTQI